MTDFLDGSLAKEIIDGKTLDKDTLLNILSLKTEAIPSLLKITSEVRYHFFGNRVTLCAICNAKSGGCSEDCSFCSQSISASSEIEKYPFLGKEKISEYALNLSSTEIKRFGVVTSGRTLSKKDLQDLVTIKTVPDSPTLCASLGIADQEMLMKLKNSGITRYHHNLETAGSFFDRVCTTHSYEDRINTVKNAKKAGLKVCSGGIFGLGETDEQIIEMAETLKELDVDSVPINFLVPIKGTKAENFNFLSPLKSLLIIALFRVVLPDKEIIICGGRRENLKAFYPFIFFAGASNLMTGDYLTTKGENFKSDIQWIKELGFEV